MLKRINQQVALFIDKIDEAYDQHIYEELMSSRAARGPSFRDIWTYAQISLAEAVYKLTTDRHHINIYFSMRKEAYVRIPSIAKQGNKLNEYLKVLEYSSDDLHKMFNTYVKAEQPAYLYDANDTITPSFSFIGIDAIMHYTGIEEVMFEYILRHSLKRPIDIMQICKALCDENVRSIPTLDERIAKLRTIVNNQSVKLYDNYMHVIQPFFADLSFSNVRRLLLGLTTNVFTLDYMKKACALYNKNNSSGVNCNKICEECLSHHPFTGLYNAGLLGEIYKNDTDEYYKSKIKPVGDMIYDDTKHSLPDATLFFLHPGLSNEANALVKNFRTNRYIIAGDNGRIENERFWGARHFFLSHIGGSRLKHPAPKLP